MRREVAALVLDLGLGVLGAALVAAGFAWFTQRGDLAKLGFELLSLASIMGFAARRILRLRRKLGTLARAAELVARTRGPLRRNSDDVAADERLRRELRAALELAQHHVGSTMSLELIDRYVDEVADRLRRSRAEADLALPSPAWRWRIVIIGTVATAWLALASSPWAPGIGWLFGGIDARPPAPPAPVWSSLTLELQYPPHTGRPARQVANPSGALRVPAGTKVSVVLSARQEAEAVRVVVAHDPLSDGTTLEPRVSELQPVEDVPSAWEGTFEVRGSGSWTVVLLESGDDDLDEASARSAPLPLHIEPDRPPEIELLPLSSEQRSGRPSVRHEDRVELRLSARDDFGLAGAELVYQLPDETTHRLPLEIPVADLRTWRERHRWDVSDIPITERSEIIYWVEVWDNDPGFGLEPLPNPPGKRARSATMRLEIRDDEAEHAQNIVRMADLRDAAVDLLAARMTTPAFAPASPPTEPTPPLAAKVAAARELLTRSASLVAALAVAVDALSMDTHVRERDVETLGGVHGRLLKMHRTELRLHENVPPGREYTDEAGAAAAMQRLGRHNADEVVALEDEIIRLDDLVDGQIIKRIEALVARLEATQRKLVDLLEQLKAGDTSVRSQIEQLEQRRRDDMRRLAEARALLSQEVDQEFMNLDAFKILEQMQQQEQLSERLREGDIDGALEQARGQLDEVQRLRDQVQQRVADGGEQGMMSEEERERMKLMRALSRLQDEEATLKQQTNALHQSWRRAVEPNAASEAVREDVAKVSESVAKRLEDVNDARLGRPGREGLEDARDALEVLETVDGSEPRGQLELFERVDKALSGLRAAQRASDPKDESGKAIAGAAKRLEQLHRKLARELPSPRDVLDEAQRKRLDTLKKRQAGLSKQADELGEDTMSEHLPAEGRRALEQAKRAMRSSGTALEQFDTNPALEQQDRAWNQLQEAIDSLRKGPPPPSARASNTEASTEAERDRSLRDALMEAMKEGAPPGFDESVKRYYEELLR